jgi:hypothetical protein
MTILSCIEKICVLISFVKILKFKSKLDFVLEQLFILVYNVRFIMLYIF